MLKIGVSQREFERIDRSEIWDCLDRQLPKKFEEHHVILIPISNSISNFELFTDSLRLDGFLLSGGNSVISTDQDYSAHRTETERKILDLAEQRKLPVVGICRGMQAMNIFKQGKIEMIHGHVGGMHSIRVRLGDKEEIRKVNSFHNYGIFEGGLGGGFRVLAHSDDQTVEAFTHESLPWLGFMWHPERTIEDESLWFKLMVQTFHQKGSQSNLWLRF